MKKILDFIFETVPEDENEEVIVNAPIVKHTFEENKPVNKNVDVNQKKNNDDINKKREEIRKNDTLSKKPSFGIEVDQNKPKKVKTKTVEVKTFKPEKKYEFQPPMSPIFGVLESRADSQTLIDNNNHPAMSTTNTKSRIGTVFSPIYGTIQVEEKETNQEVIDEENDTIINEELDTNVEAEDLNDTIEETSIDDGYEEVKLDLDDNTEDIITNDNEDSFKDYFKEEVRDEDIVNGSIDNILVKPKDETYIFSHDISLFDDESDK